ncbi:MAG: EAL domain-containing protein [Clostridia bacterium]|nr:EAL domain-containing protein [Clostridia bacterium]
MKRYHYTQGEQSHLEKLRVPLGIYQMEDNRAVPVVLSEGFCRLFDYPSPEEAGRRLEEDRYRDIHPDDVERVRGMFSQFAEKGGKYETVFRLRPREAEKPRIIHAVGETFPAGDGTPLVQIWYTDEGVYQEQVDMENLTNSMSNALHEESILNASRYDYLTGLPCMAYFFQLAEKAREGYAERNDVPVLLYMDMSGMKYFNSRYSFAEGDQLLREFSTLLADTFEKKNCCHIAADQFAAITTEDRLEERLNAFLEKCRKLNGGNTLPVHIGIYSSRIGSVAISTACDRAKFACDSCKNQFESGFAYYDHGQRNDALQRQYILNMFDRAIREGWITVYYQPIVRAVNGCVCDEEALARWNDSERGMLSPAAFIPCLEDAEVIYRLDLYVLDRVLEKLQSQMHAGLYTVPISINLSRSDFKTCDIVEEVRQRVDAAGISHDRITIEITESTIGQDFDYMKQQVIRFQKLGFPVWMDDFGSGYSSLELLQSLRFNLIKFDMSFMQKLDEGENGKTVLRELMRMAGSLGTDTVCEGVETEKQVRFLKEIGCSKLQGYYFCKPIPFEGILERYRTGRQIGFENPKESGYYETIGRVNLYDFATLVNGTESMFQNVFSSMPVAILEAREGTVRFARFNSSFREFMLRFYETDIANTTGYTSTFFGDRSEFMKMVRSCCDGDEGRSYFDELLPDGLVAHCFARKLSVNPVTGTVAMILTVLSVTDPDEGTTYASIARALAADYYNIYYVNLDTEQFIEYSSAVGEENLALERHGEHFFDEVKQAAVVRIYEADRGPFLENFTKEKILDELDRHRVFTISYRLIDSGEPMSVNMKVMRMQGGNKVILGIRYEKQQ